MTSASVLAIPKQWDGKWFRDLISNQLQGADVRNAVGVNGIVVSGTIASPYATIGFGAPVTLPGTVTITNPSSGLTLNVGGFVSFETAANLTSAGSLTSGIVFVSSVSPTRGRIYIGDKTGWHTFFSNFTGGVTTDLIEFADGVSGGHPIVTINAQPSTEGLKINGATGGSCAHFFPAVGLFGLAITAPSGSNQFGLLLDASVGGVTRAGIQLISNVGTNTFMGTADAAGDLATGTANGDMVIRTDTNNLWLTSSGGVQVGASGQQVGFFGTAAISRITGYGTPTGGSHQASFAAGSITLPNLAAAVAQLIVDLKAYGLIAA